jgi:transcriptional regulator with XRE-family HTH domain
MTQSAVARKLRRRPQGRAQGAGITQSAVAKKLRRPRSFVAKFDNGERRIDVVEFVVLARVFETDPAALLRTFVEGRGDGTGELKDIPKRSGLSAAR